MSEIQWWHVVIVWVAGWFTGLMCGYGKWGDRR